MLQSSLLSSKSMQTYEAFSQFGNTSEACNHYVEENEGMKSYDEVLVK